MSFWLMCFISFLGVFVITLIPSREKTLIKMVCLVFSLVVFIHNLLIVKDFLNMDSGQFSQTISWMSIFGLDWSISIDSLSLSLILLTTFLIPICIGASWTQITTKVKGFYICLLLLEASVIGVFITSNLWVFYIFWEMMLIPMYLMIGIWGSDERIKASIKFVLFTLAGSLLMLVGILALGYLHYIEHGQLNFSIAMLSQLSIPVTLQKWIFVFIMIGLAVKIPLIPFHTWLPDAHGQAPTAGSVMLAAILLKMGVFGIFRICIPILPQAVIWASPFLMVLGVVGIIYGAFLAWAQTDIKRLIAYSSISHLGFCMIGIMSLNVKGISGGMLQMINHGISTGALFILVGILYERAHTKQIEEFGQLAKSLPVYSTVFLFVTFSSIGLPGLNNFIGEILCLLGSFETYPRLTVVSLLGVIFAAVYMLSMVRRVFFGIKKGTHNYEQWMDMTFREGFLLIPLIFLMIWIGVYSKPILKPLEKSAENYIEMLNKPQYWQQGSQNNP